MIHSNGATFPFAAIVGQDLMRLSLALNAINPSIGGVLIRGERGTAKSTAVRGLAAVLPEIEVATCTYGCAPGFAQRLRGVQASSGRMATWSTPRGRFAWWICRCLPPRTG